MKVRCTIWLGALVVTLFGATPAAAATPFPPGGFRLPAGNGYSIHALSFDGDPRGERDELILFVGRKGAGATYFALRNVTVTETTIAADLGRLGSLDLHFVPSGETKKEHPRCAPRQQVEFDSGFYEGRVDFEGEEEFTSVHATRAAGEVRLALNLICPGGPRVDGTGPHLPGAKLHVHRSWSGGSLDLEARTNSPDRPARVEASIEEHRTGLAVIRSVTISSPPPGFAYDVGDQVARLSPPSPFRGSGHFDGSGPGAGRLLGALRVDFPGRSDVALAGASGGLSRYMERSRLPRPLQRPARFSR